MRSSEPLRHHQPADLRQYLVASGGLHLVWETLQLPLYTVWWQPLPSRASAVLHCTVGDVMIAGVTLLAALGLSARSEEPRPNPLRVWLYLVLLGAAYTMFSEWFNVTVRRSWAYSHLMPTLPGLGTGLSPLLQWIIVPTLVVRLSIGRWPWLGPRHYPC